MATKTVAKGTVVKHGASASPSTVLNQVRSVSVSPGERPMIDSTTHDSSSTKDYVPNPLRDTEDLEIVLAWDPDDAGHEAIRAAHAAATKYYFTVVFPNTGAAQWAAAGYITKFSPPAMAPDGIMEVSVGYKADSAETYTQ